MAQSRLVIAASRFWPLVGDIPTHFLRLAESLVASGISVTIVTPQWAKDWPRQMAIGPMSLVRLRGAPRGGWSTLRWMYSLSRWLREQQPSDLLVAGLRHEAYVALGAQPHTQTRVIAIAGEGDLAWQQTATFGNRIMARC